MSDRTQRYLFGFWTLINEMLNSVLLLMMGLEVLVLRFEPAFGWLMALAMPLVLSARLAAISERLGPADRPIPEVRTWNYFGGDLGRLVRRYLGGVGAVFARYRREIRFAGSDICCGSVYLGRAGFEFACRNQAGSEMTVAVLAVLPTPVTKRP